MNRDSLPILVLCNGATLPKTFDRSSYRQILTLDYENKKTRNINIELPEFINSIYHIPDQILDLVEIAAHVFLADRFLSRGAVDTLEYSGWGRRIHFRFKVREFDFWNNRSIKDKLINALLFMTGDIEYVFDFQPNRHTPPASLLDSPEFELSKDVDAHVALFSGGMDSYAGAIQYLESNTNDLYLVSHRSQPSTIGTQIRLVNALSELYPNRITHVSFRCNRRNAQPIEESQRTRAFLYTAIAYTLAHVLSTQTLHIYENGVTALNLPKRADQINARASRTTHPKTIWLLEELYSEVSGKPFKINSPFAWKTKADIFQLAEQGKHARLISSTVSCSRTYQRLNQKSHCGGCSQCIDRRFAAHASGLDDYDEGNNYKINFVLDKITSPEIKPSLFDYIRQARDFAEFNLDHFNDIYLKELAAATENLSDSAAEQHILRIWELCSRHGHQVSSSLKLMGTKYASPYDKIPPGSLLEVISKREYLRDPVDRFVDQVCGELETALPIAFQRKIPTSENALNDYIESYLSGNQEGYKREHPTIAFGLTHAVPDHSFADLNLLVETKFVRGNTRPSVISAGIAEDLTKYPSHAHKLFLIYDPQRAIHNDEEFERPFLAIGNCSFCFIR